MFKKLQITRVPLRWKIIGITAGVVLLMRLTEYLYVHTIMVKELETEFLARFSGIMKHISSSITNPMLTENTSTISHILKETKSSDPDILYIYLLKDRNKILSHTFIKGFPIDLLKLSDGNIRWKTYEGMNYISFKADKKKIYHIKTALPLNNEAELHMGFSTDYIKSVINQINYIFSAITLFLFIIAIGISTYLSSKITKPINEIVSATNLVGIGDFSQRININTGDELETLGTNFNRMVENLEKSKAELEKTFEKLLQTEKFTAIGTLSAGLAHELNNPLSGIYNLLKILKTKELPEEKREEYFRVIFESLDRVQNIVRRLLDYTRKEDDGLIENINIRDLIKNSLLLIPSTTSETLLHFVDHLPPSGGIVYGNKEQLQEVIMNILLNALYAIKDKPDGKIIIEGTLNNGMVHITITDNGDGIPATIKHRIFDPFFTTKPAGMGTGLGLPLSLRIIEKHGGELYVESIENVGTTVKILLPVKEE